MADSLLSLFQTAYRNLDLLPLLDQKDLDRFRVEYGGDVIDQLVQLVEDSGAADSKIIFSGHRGCGKSTLLAEFSRSPLMGDLFELPARGRYFVVLFSIAKVIEMSDVDHINILFAIALNLMVEAEKHQVEVPKTTQNAIYKWFAEQTQTDVKELKGEAKVGINLLEAVSLQLQTNAGVRREIKQKFERILPGFHIIYTIPMATLRDKEILPTIETETNNQLVSRPVLKLFAKDECRLPNAVPKPEVMDILCAILHKRISDRLLDRQTAEKMIRYSGGVLRELIRIANECCRICLRLIRRDPTQAIVINEAILEEAVNKLRNDFSLRLGKVDYEILSKVYTELMPDDPTQKEFLDLLHGLHVLEYRNRKTWYDVHPIVVELLTDRNLI
ncbi:hypothetical protein ACKFKF_03050 [Phormidesmis sp. 146-12]